MSGTATGTLIGIASRGERRAPMVTAESGAITLEAGLLGDHKGVKSKRRAVTVLAREAWEAALADLGSEAAALPWTVRRANLLTEGMRLPRAPGGQIRIGQAVLKVTQPTLPCKRMEEAFPGLQKALYPDWRGGISCEVLTPGAVAFGDPVTVLVDPPERKIRLPG